MLTQPLPVPAAPALLSPIRRILVPVDFSGLSFAAVRRAVDLAGIHHASLILAHVSTHRPTPSRRDAEAQHPPVAGLEFHEEIELLRQLALDRGISCTALFRTGAIVENVCDLIRQESIDLVVLASHGGRSRCGIFLGSTAEQLIRSIEVPVLTVSSDRQPQGWDEKGPRHILFAANFDKSSLTGLSVALALREVTGAQVSVAEILPFGVWPDIQSILRKRIVSLVPPGTDVHLALGSVGSKVCQVAAECNAGLIVLGVQPDSFLRGIFGSNLMHILLHAPCPVLTVREPGHAKAVAPASPRTGNNLRQTAADT